MRAHDLLGGCDRCLTRRDFLGRVALVASAAIAAGCGASDLTVGTDPLAGGPITFKPSDYAGLTTAGQPVEIRTSTGAASGIAVVRTSANTFLALAMTCTHAGTKVNIVGQVFDCPNHGARFNSSGGVTLGPATRSLTQRTLSCNATADTITVSQVRLGSTASASGARRPSPVRTVRVTEQSAMALRQVAL